MIRISLRRILAGAVLVPLALGLAGCGKSDASYPGLSGKPIAKIAPPQGESWSDVVEKTPANGYRMGNPDAPIKLVEFASLTCPHCAHFADQSTPELRDDFVDSGRVSYEFRNFILNPLDLTISMVVRCGATESFFGLVEQVYTNQRDILENWQNASEKRQQEVSEQSPPARYGAIAQVLKLPEFFAARGIASDQTKACLADSKNAQTLADMTSKQGDEFDVTGTPTFLINGRKLDVNTWPAIKADLEKLGAR